MFNLVYLLTLQYSDNFYKIILSRYYIMIIIALILYFIVRISIWIYIISSLSKIPLTTRLTYDYYSRSRCIVFDASLRVWTESDNMRTGPPFSSIGSISIPYFLQKKILRRFQSRSAAAVVDVPKCEKTTKNIILFFLCTI